MDKYTGVGIKEELIENYNEYKDLIRSLICCICLDIVRIPMECDNCESLYCQECWEILKIAGKKCVLHCNNSNIVKANKFVRDVLSKLKITCETCYKTGIDYNIYVKHMGACILSQKISTNTELNSIIKEKDSKIDELTQELEGLKVSKPVGTPNAYGSMSKEALRNYLVSFNLTSTQKRELYDSAIGNKVEEFRNLILVKNYPILEEVSAPKYFWTSLHYAMHYGTLAVIVFIMDYLKEKKILDISLKLKSSDERCPLLCLLKSNFLKGPQKAEIFDKLLSRYDFEISAEVRKELRNRDMENMLKKYKK